ncbi:SagB/ThcOx family dehydrogenase [Microseira sp. BLCC-F43]|jgi:nitroreductase|uniref:SagB/ThcOx family dehydrogenase n=1 Tax=Microseira sp. BLCC-F43 TaxID=3153602 RepID=UPI0035BAB83B
MQTDETFVRMLAATPEVQQPKLYEIYHENTKMHPLLEARVVNADTNPNAALNRQTNMIAIAEIESTVATGGKKYRFATRHQLPHALDTIGDVTLKDVLERRESMREFQPEPVTLEQLAVLCELTYGWNPKRDVELDGGEISFRYAPSAGRLYPLELYLVIPAPEDAQTPRRGDGECDASQERSTQSQASEFIGGEQENCSLLQSPGSDRGVSPSPRVPPSPRPLEDECDIWHYEPNSHAIERIHRVKAAEIRAAFVHFPQRLPVVALLTGVIPRLTWKYGDRAYRYAHLEAGHVGQNLVLAATALNLGACPIVSFYDDAIHDLLDVDGVSEIVLYSFFIGHPDTSNPQD